MPAISSVRCFRTQLNYHIRYAIQYFVGGIWIGKVGDLVLPVPHAVIEAQAPLFHMLIEQIQKASNSFYKGGAQRQSFGSPLYEDQDIILPFTFPYYRKRLNAKIARKFKRRSCVKKAMKRAILPQPTNKGGAYFRLITRSINFLEGI